MNPSRVIKSLLLAFVVAAVAWLVFRPAFNRMPEPAAQGIASPSVPTSSVPVPARRVVAYYFHGKIRCVTCNRIEALSRKAITEGFPEASRDGSLLFREVSFDDPANRHFVDTYQLSGQTLIVVEEVNGKVIRWRKMDEIWTRIEDEKVFVPYIQAGISEYLRGV